MWLPSCLRRRRIETCCTFSMFGRGIYFADTPHKSWQYTSGGSKRLMLMSRVELGVVKLKKKGDSGQAGRHTQSVVGLTEDQGGSLRAPEYVIYDPRQARVEYILELREARAQDQECDKI